MLSTDLFSDTYSTVDRKSEKSFCTDLPRNINVENRVQNRNNQLIELVGYYALLRENLIDVRFSPENKNANIMCQYRISHVVLEGVLTVYVDPTKK